MAPGHQKPPGVQGLMWIKVHTGSFSLVPLIPELTLTSTQSKSPHLTTTGRGEGSCWLLPGAFWGLAGH